MCVCDDFFQDTAMSKVWFKQDDKFFLPKACLNFEFFRCVKNYELVLQLEHKVLPSNSTFYLLVLSSLPPSKCVALISFRYFLIANNN